MPPNYAESKSESSSTSALQNELPQDDTGKGQDVEVASKHSRSSHRSAAKSTGLASATETTDSSITGNGKQIVETMPRKLMYMMSAFLALILHVLYLIVLVLMSNGWVLPFNPESFKNTGAIIFQTWGIIAFVSMEVALNDAFAAFVGYLLSRKEGFSIAACGFAQANLIEKLKFPSRLSFRSEVKPFLTKFSLLFGLHFLMLILTVIASTAITAKSSRVNGNSLMCLQYSQNHKYPVDRGQPTVAIEMGVAELIDGTALGSMRYNDFALSHSTHLLPPQLTDVCADGSTIQGPGLATDVSSGCVCSASSSYTDLRVATGLDASDSTLVQTYVKSLVKTYGWVNHIKQIDDQVINVTSILTGTNLCGGFNSTLPAVPVCRTQISNHRFIGTLVQYKTDGTPASIAAKEVIEYDYEGVTTGSANITWLYTGLNNLFGSSISYNILPPHWPGSVNPLLWMSTENMREPTPSLLEPGMESAIALMIRAAIQRTYSVSGGYCTQVIGDVTTVTVLLNGYGLATGLIWVIFQLIINLAVFIAYIPWWVGHHPILPAIQIARDPVLFCALSSKSSLTNTRIKRMHSSIEEFLVWPKLDVVARVGESVATREDPERGVIVLERPKMVSDLSFDKIYF